MQGGRGRGNGLFGFGIPLPGLGSSVRPGSLMSSFFGGRNPFDDPFFANPFGPMMPPTLPGSNIPGIFGSDMPGMFGSSMSGTFGPSMFGNFGPSMFGTHGNLNGGVHNPGGFLQQAPEPSRPTGPIIKELPSDGEDDADVNKEDEKKNADSKKHPRMSKMPYVEEPDEEVQGLFYADNKRHKHDQFGRECVRASTSHPQQQTYMFQSSTVTYGGPNGAFYTSSATRRTGGDGITMEEKKEADTTTGKATHMISRGIGYKGHSLTRKLESNGNVDTMQTLHNLNEDELDGFEATWRRNTGQNLHGRDPRVNVLGSGAISSENHHRNQTFALPAPEQSLGSNFSGMKRNSRNGSSSSRGLSRRT